MSQTSNRTLSTRQAAKARLDAKRKREDEAVDAAAKALDALAAAEATVLDRQAALGEAVEELEDAGFSQAAAAELLSVDKQMLTAAKKAATDARAREDQAAGAAS